MARKLFADAAVVATSVVTYAETRASLARLQREGELTRIQWTVVLSSTRSDVDVSTKPSAGRARTVQGAPPMGRLGNQ